MTGHSSPTEPALHLQVQFLHQNRMYTQSRAGNITTLMQQRLRHFNFIQLSFISYTDKEIYLKTKPKSLWNSHSTEKERDGSVGAKVGVSGR